MTERGHDRKARTATTNGRSGAGNRSFAAAGAVGPSTHSGYSRHAISAACAPGSCWLLFGSFCGGPIISCSGGLNRLIMAQHAVTNACRPTILEQGERMSLIGHVESVWRYPVKSMAGEELPEIYAGFGEYGVIASLPLKARLHRSDFRT